MSLKKPKTLTLTVERKPKTYQKCCKKPGDIKTMCFLWFVFDKVKNNENSSSGPIGTSDRLGKVGFEPTKKKFQQSYNLPLLATQPLSRVFSKEKQPFSCPFLKWKSYLFYKV